MTVWVVIHDNGRWTIRTTSVAPKYLSGPDKDCEQHEAVLSPRAARSIARAYLASLPPEEDE